MPPESDISILPTFAQDGSAITLVIQRVGLNQAPIGDEELADILFAYAEHLESAEPEAKN